MAAWRAWYRHDARSVGLIMSRKMLAQLAVVLVFALAALMYFWLKPGGAAAERIACEDIVRGCRHDDLTIQAMTTPKVMQAFEMRVTLPEAESVQASFDMQDMQMGINRYRLQQQPDGSWRAMVTLPVCVSESSDWVMTLDIKRPSQPLRTQYTLEFSAQP
ncbi:hypothetical protein IHQ56_11205 [Methylobacillus flagellatus]|uniref:hypothetical protein n=1 Tax=Methylobacillus flagellatus TaxID=405 RepID=UPI0028539C15|nr:hypothetical protein [Methylobacillus flagellatus]MDR5172388.1 hypothetical protein [Methylobacillus flagellatus]